MLLQHPHPFEELGPPQRYLAHVTAESRADAVLMAQMEAHNEIVQHKEDTLAMDPEDFPTLWVQTGHHTSIRRGKTQLPSTLPANNNH